MITSCSIVIRKPLGQEQSTLGIRAAWAMYSGADIDVAVILMGDGIYSALGKEGYIPYLYNRLLAEEGKIYAVKEDLESRNIHAEMLPKGIAVCSATEIADIVEERDSVMTF